MSDVDLSVVVCSRDRAHDVDACLRSLLPTLDGSDLRAGRRVEVVFVDNGSTDDTADVVRSHGAEAPRIRYVHESTPGLSVARNRGVATANGRIVAFLDDDATVREGWADALIDAFDDGADAVAGRILLAWPHGRTPAWFDRSMDHWFTQLDLGDQPMALGPSQNPWGANMAVRLDLADAVGGFDPSLGRVGASLLSGEEEEFFRRVRRHLGADADFRYVPSATVDHHVQPDRLSLRWVARRSFHNGRSVAIARRLGGEVLGVRSELRVGLRSLLRSVFGGWPAALRRVRDADDRGRRIAAELTMRCQPLGAGVEHLRAARGAIGR